MKCEVCKKNIRWEDGTLFRGGFGGLFDVGGVYEVCENHLPKDPNDLEEMKIAERKR